MVVLVYVIFVIVYYLSFSMAKIVNVYSLEDISLSNAKCDFIVSDTGYYDNDYIEYKFLQFKWKNKSLKKIYFWGTKEKILNGHNLVDLNLSVVEKEENGKQVIFTGILIPNYSILCKQGFAINPGQEILLLTTAEQNFDIDCDGVKYKVRFTKKWLLKDGIQISGYYFMVPIIKIINHGVDLQDSIFEFKFALLFDYDNDLSTIKDNFVLVGCYKLDIGRCGDGKVENQFGEECDPANVKDNKFCYNNCKYQLETDLVDKDGDGIPDDEDIDPNVPEDFDGNEDLDGILDDICFGQSCFPQWNVKVLCDTCPCPMADYNGDLWYGDKIKATLWDKTGNKLQGMSKEKFINYNF